MLAEGLLYLFHNVSYIPSFYRPFLVFLNVKKRESSSTKVSNLRVNLLSEKAGAQHWKKHWIPQGYFYIFSLKNLVHSMHYILCSTYYSNSVPLWVAKLSGWRKVIGEEEDCILLHCTYFTLYYRKILLRIKTLHFSEMIFLLTETRNTYFSGNWESVRVLIYSVSDMSQ